MRAEIWQPPRSRCLLPRMKETFDACEEANPGKKVKKKEKFGKLGDRSSGEA